LALGQAAVAAERLVKRRRWSVERDGTNADSQSRPTTRLGVGRVCDSAEGF
jgi:hypothetical protein